MIKNIPILLHSKIYLFLAFGALTAVPVPVVAFLLNPWTVPWTRRWTVELSRGNFEVLLPLPANYNGNIVAQRSTTRCVVNYKVSTRTQLKQITYIEVANGAKGGRGLSQGLVPGNSYRRQMAPKTVEWKKKENTKKMSLVKMFFFPLFFFLTLPCSVSFTRCHFVLRHSFKRHCCVCVKCWLICFNRFL